MYQLDMFQGILVRFLPAEARQLDEHRQALQERRTAPSHKKAPSPPTREDGALLRPAYIESKCRLPRIPRFAHCNFGSPRGQCANHTKVLRNSRPAQAIFLIPKVFRPFVGLQGGRSDVHIQLVSRPMIPASVTTLSNVPQATTWSVHVTGEIHKFLDFRVSI